MSGGRPPTVDRFNGVAVPEWVLLPATRILVAGCDPGAFGAVAVVDAKTERVEFAVPLPFREQTINKKARKRTDMAELDALINALVAMDVCLFVGENVGAGFGSGGRALGEGCGMIKFAVWKAMLRDEWITPQVWKKELRAPADKKESFYRAEMLFPKDKHMFMGPKGGKRDGLAEAAMIALYGCRKLLGKAFVDAS